MAKLTVLIIAFVLLVVLWRVPEWGPALAVVSFLSCLTVGMIPAAIYDAVVKRAERKKAENRASYQQMVGRINRNSQPQRPVVTFLIDARSVHNHFGDALPPEVETVEHTRMGRSKS